MCSSLPGHRLRPWTSPTPIAVTTQPGPGPRPERVWPGAWAAQVSFVHPCTARLCPGHPLPPRSPLPARPAQYRQPPHTITLLPTKSDQPLCSGACCKRPPTAGNDLPQNPPVPKTPPDLQAIPTPNLVATMVATPCAAAVATPSRGGGKPSRGTNRQQHRRRVRPRLPETPLTVSLFPSPNPSS